ncbi:MAG: tryptophan synthase subunit alpha [Saprospiraceae bacterium]|nr:tryptophan synthase subunit alpha [Saprospiraceae bacterium]
MNRLQQLFSKKKEHILNIYFTAGFPNLDDTEAIVLALEKAGVDLIEIGMPYSDPLADGPTIQQSSQVALANGMTLRILFDQIRSIRKKTQIPLVLMGYFNQMMQYGETAFLEACKTSGIDGLILPDMPLEEYEKQYKSHFEALDLGISFLITPQTKDARILKAAELTRGFIYMVSNDAITGGSTELSDRQLAYFQRISDMKLPHPRLIGFGISDRSTFETACRFANGAIIGSAFIRVLENADDVGAATAAFIGGIR